MRRIVHLLALFLVALTTPVAAEPQFFYYYAPAWAQPAATRYVAPPARVERAAIATYGPFRVLDERTAALVGVTDSRSPAAFQRMLRNHPGIATLRFVDCPGTYDDRANLSLGRLIRAAGIAAHVPAGGSVRSGAVELVLAGTSLTIDDGAEFAVHAWLDDSGREATDYAADSPAHRRYLSYYREMGMDAGEAASFYAMTNSVPFEDARWLTGREMRRWVGRSEVTQRAAPRLASRHEATAHRVGPLAVVAPSVPAPAAEPQRAADAEAPVFAVGPRLAYLDLGLTLF